MAKMMWGGRFDRKVAKTMLEFTSKEDSFLDSKLTAYDIEGSLAHVCMLAKQKIITRKEAANILAALLKIRKRAEEGKFKISPMLEDVHTNIESAVIKITSDGKKMHTARSRNDQLSVDARMYLRDAINRVSDSLIELQKSLAALQKKDCEFPAYTHYQVAQPISVSFWAHSHYQAIERDLQRLAENYAHVNACPLGSGAVAGTAWNIDRNYTAKLLGFEKPTENPMDTVGSRGELEAEYLGSLVLAMVHASRIAEDIILASNKGLVLLPDEYSTGSSIMPQKKNPDLFEIIRGRANRMLGLYVMAAGLSRGLPSGFNRDTQESKFAMILGTEIAVGSFSILAEVIPKLEFDRKAIADELERGYACATELADLLARKGVPFRLSHEIVGRIVKRCFSEKKFLSELTVEDIRKEAGVAVSEDELKDAVSVNKVSRFSEAYKMPAKPLHLEEVAKRRKALAAAKALLEKEVKSLLS